jgi:hypothetical protein
LINRVRRSFILAKKCWTAWSARVEERLIRSSSALAAANVPFALGGSNATSVWIASVDESAVRNARNVELVLLRADLNRATAALMSVGFVPTSRQGRLRFLDGPDGKIRAALEITFGGDPVDGQSPTLSAPGPNESELVGIHRVLRLQRLVEFQLARDRLDDAVDATWPAKFQPEPAARLQHLLDTPDG